MNCTVCGTKLRRTSSRRFRATGDEWFCPTCNETYASGGQDTTYRESWLDSSTDDVPYERRS